MAQVPEYGLQQEMPQANVAPVAMHVPQDNALLHYQEQVSQPNRELEGIVRKAAEEMDKARVTDAETQLYKFMIDRRMGENGYNKLKLQQAMEPDADGNSLPDREDIAMQERIKEITKEMGLNLRQQEMFGQRAQSYRRQQYGTASQHMFQEAQAYRIKMQEGKREAAIQSAGLHFDEMEGVAADLARAQEAAAEMMRGADERSVLNAQRSAADSVVGAAIDGAISASSSDVRNIHQANALLEQFSPFMTPAKIAEYRAKIDKVKDDVDTTSIAEDLNRVARPMQMGPIMLANEAIIEQNGFVATGKEKAAAIYVFGEGVVPQETRGRHSEVVEETDEKGNKVKNARVIVGRYRDGSLPPEPKRAYGVSQIQIGNARFTAEKLLGEKFDEEKFRNDATSDGRAYNFRLGQAFFGEMLRKAKGDVALAVAYYHDGETVVNEARKRAQTEGGKWVDYLGPEGRDYVASVMARIRKKARGDVYDASGNKVDPLNVRECAAARRYYSQIDVENLIATRAAQGDVACGKAMYDPDFKAEIIRKTLDRQRIEADDYRVKQSNLMAQAATLALQGKELPAELASQMTYAQIERVGELRTKALNRDGSGDLSYAMRLSNSLHQEFLNYSEDDMRLALSRCPRAQARLLEQAWYKNREDQQMAQQGRVNRIAAAQAGQIDASFQAKRSTVQGEVKALLEDDDVEKLGGTDGVEMLTTAMLPGIARRMQSEGIKPDEASVREYVRKVLNDNYRINGFFTTSIKPIFKLGVGDLPSDGKDDVLDNMKALAKMNFGITGREPSDGEIMEAFIDFMTSPYPRLDASRLTLSEAALNDLKKKYPRDNNTRILRRYFRDRVDGVVPVATPKKVRVVTSEELMPEGGINSVLLGNVGGEDVWVGQFD